MFQNSQVTMIFKPIFLASIKKDVFVTPPLGNLMCFSNEMFNEEYEADVDFLVSSFHSLFSHYNVQEDIYSLGKLSNYVAEKLENFTASVNKRKVNLFLKNLFLILLVLKVYKNCLFLVEHDRIKKSVIDIG